MVRRRILSTPFRATGKRSSGVPLLVLAVAIAGGFAGPALAQPSGPSFLHGTATLTRDGRNLTVTTTNGAETRHSAIDWRSFSVPECSTTYFAQPDAGSTSINRVTGPFPSAIMGTLGSNGRLVLVNPSGIAIGSQAVIDTAGFAASTLRMSREDAIAGRERFASHGFGRDLSVQGRIVARSGDVVLIGPDVQVGRSAVVEAQGGSTILAAGQSVEITGRGLEGIRFGVQAPIGRAVNLGTLKGDAVGIFADTLVHSGLVTARSAVDRGGKVVLLAGEITLGPTAVVDASGTRGGGTVLVGGDSGGAGIVDGKGTARDVLVFHGAQLHADATDDGDGGRVVVRGEQTAVIHGRISARGGSEGGNGGFVETSAKVLDVTQAVDVSAPGGTAGRWLLQAGDVDVASGSAGFPWPWRPGRIATDAIVEALDGGATVEIRAQRRGFAPGTIRIRDALTRTSAANSTLELHADHDVLIDAPLRSAGEAGGQFNLLLDADSNRNGSGVALVRADIDTGGGTLRAPWEASSVSLGTDGDALRLRARLAEGRFDLNADLCDSELLVDSGRLTWWGGATLRNSTVAVLKLGMAELANAGDASALHRLWHSEFWNFGYVSFASGAGDLVLDGGSLVRNALSDAALAARFGMPAGEVALGSWQFQGDAVVRGNAGTFRNQGILTKTGATPVEALAATLDAPTTSIDTTTTLFDATGIDVVMDRGSYLWVGSGTVRLTRSPASSETPFVNRGVLFVDQGATFSAEGHPLTNAGGFISGFGRIVASSLRNEGDLAPGSFGGAIGTLTLDSDFVQAGAGELLIALRSPSEHARLQVNGRVALGGTLVPIALPGAAFAEGDSFDVITGATFTEGTASVAPDAAFQAAAQPGGLRLVAGTPASVPPAAPAPAPAASPSAPPPPDTPAGRIVEALGDNVTLAQAERSLAETQGTLTSALDSDPHGHDGRVGSNDNGVQCLR